MPENTFDIVSKIELPEVSNAIQQALKEIHTRFDLKDAKANIEFDNKETITLSAVDEYKMKAVNDILQQKLVKRGVSLKGLTYQKVESALGATARQKITMQQGIPIEKAKEIVRIVKDSKKKVQASIQGDLVRISGKDRDSLQETIALLKQKDLGLDMQFTNYRSN
jgi:cyclic-di-GMP-binding protein